MSMSIGLQQTQKLSQELAPRMIQSMEILQLPTLALQERIEQELEDNPVLEAGLDADADADADADDWQGSDADPAEDNPDGVLNHDEDNLSDFQRMEEINRDWDDWFNEEHRPTRAGLEEEGDRKHDAMQNMPSRPETLQDRLNDQVLLLDMSDEMAELVRFVIGFIDHTGYLGERTAVEKIDGRKRTKKREADTLPEMEEVFTPLTVEQIAARHDPPFDPEELEEALELVQTLEPPGVGARSTQECLLLQIPKDAPNRGVMERLVEDHFDDIRENRLPVIAEQTGFAMADIKAAIEQLGTLNLRPGAEFIETPAHYVTPDLVIDEAEDGSYEVRLLDDWVPNVHVSRYYHRLSKTTDPKTRKYLKDKIMAAQWLIDAIEQRKRTITRVAKAIIAHQEDFLRHGPEAFKPLKMQQIADVVGVHVTTVSRAVDDKWIQTPRGVLALKRFFGGAAKNDNNEEIAAWETIKRKLLDIIENEDKQNPLSDEELVNRLNEAGYPVARRTVTKYRKMLKIPPSRQRKAW